MKKIFLLFFVLNVVNTNAQSPGNWRFAKGDKYDPLATVYGTQGIASSENTLNTLQQHTSWSKGDSLFVFGGVNSVGMTNELWVYVKGQWIWLKGGPGSNLNGEYGVKGIGAPGNTPGRRQNSKGWVKGDTIFLFGGRHYSGTDINDLWAYTKGNWVWIKGSNTPGQIGVYGTQGVADSANTPGARRHHFTWTKGDTLFLYGGQGDTSLGKLCVYSDLWAFANGNWIWIKGKYDGTVVGTIGVSSPNNTPGRLTNATGWVKGDSLFLFGGLQGSVQFTEHFNILWAYANGQWVWLKGGGGTGIYGIKGIASPDNTPGKRASSISWIKGDSLFLYGGDYSSVYSDLWAYINGNWVWLKGSSNAGVELAKHGIRGIANPSNTPGMRSVSISWIKGDSMFLFGGSTSPSVNAVWAYVNGIWVWVNGSSSTNNIAVYGTKGIASPTNKPGPLMYGVSWTKGDSLFLYGGLPDANSGFYDNLWVFKNGNWTWLKGSADTLNKPAVYGTKGVAAAVNTPGARQGSVSWLKGDSLFLFGGVTSNSINDLWAYANGQWVWLNGSNVEGEHGVYGTKGVAATGNVPGARHSSTSWVKNDTLFLFGGMGYSASGSSATLNDLWGYINGQWIWLKGTNTTAQYGIYGAKSIAASTNNPGSRFKAQSWSKVDTLFLFGGEGYATNNGANRYGRLNDLWAYANGNWIWISGDNVSDIPGVYVIQGQPATTNSIGARDNAITWANGNKLFLFSGFSTTTIYTNIPNGFYNDLWDFKNGNWVWEKGSNDVNQFGVYSGSESSFTPGARRGSVSWRKGDSLFLFGGEGYYINGGAINGGSKGLNDMWVYNSLSYFNTLLCPNGSVSLPSPNSGSSYQWQLNNGTGFANITDNANYSGTGTATLQLINIPSSFYGYEYRCVVNGINSDAYKLEFAVSWIGGSGSAWENTANWNCGVLPDANTNVIINSGPVIINSLTFCRSLKINPAIVFTVNSGNITISH